jgi:hypothetical protein
MKSMRLTKAAAAAYRDSNPAERGLFGVGSSFAVTPSGCPKAAFRSRFSPLGRHREP